MGTGECPGYREGKGGRTGQRETLGRGGPTGDTAGPQETAVMATALDAFSLTG